MRRQHISAARERGLDSWERRLQRVRMRTKLVVPMVVLAVGPAVAIGSFMIWRTRDSLQESIVRRVEFDTASKARAVHEFLSNVQQDLRFLSQTKPIRDLISLDAAQGAVRFAALREEVERDFLFFQRGRSYCQAQCLSAVGEQLVQLDARGDALQLVPPQQLQNRRDQFYVKEASVLTPGQVYVSPMHLDVVHGMVGAVMRFATPVIGHDGFPRGLLVVGVCVDHILAQIGPLPSGMEAWLVNQDGVYLGYVGDSPKKRILYSLEKQRRIKAEFTPDQTAALLRIESRPPAVKTAGALLFASPIVLKGDNSVQHWTLLISYPRAPIEAPIRRLTIFLSVVMVLIVAVSGVLGILITHYLARPVDRLRRATREIAAGDLSKRVEVTTGDEIEALATDFNTMTERLSEAQARLAQWNVELEREVALQTEKIRQLQTGLARADKLASIGQITAGVMHEIGNPLAAIKTKIQVAEEAGGLDLEQQSLLKEILAEVDRLASFLHSFSRLARLRDHPVKETVSLANVVNSVVALLGPDLKRRGVRLRCERSSDAPKICGDAEQLRHLLMNLILNGAEASPDGGEVIVKIQRWAKEPGVGGASLQVIDRGTGINPDVLDKIWNPFFTTKPEGTGLGLAICRQIVQEHDGVIQIHSEPAKGTIVTVSFPELKPQTPVDQRARRENSVEPAWMGVE